jgi:hypothetical protein
MVPKSLGLPGEALAAEASAFTFLQMSSARQESLNAISSWPVRPALV